MAKTADKKQRIALDTSVLACYRQGAAYAQSVLNQGKKSSGGKKKGKAKKKEYFPPRTGWRGTGSAGKSVEIQRSAGWEPENKYISGFTVRV